MEGVFIRWSIENWITVVLMAMLGYIIFAIGAQIFLNKKNPPSVKLQVVA